MMNTKGTHLNEQKVHGSNWDDEHNAFKKKDKEKRKTLVKISPDH